VRVGYAGAMTPLRAGLLIGLTLMLIGCWTPVEAADPETQTAQAPVEASASPAQLIAQASGLAPDDAGVARELQTLSRLCGQDDLTTGDQVAKATSLVSTPAAPITIARMLHEAVLTQPLSGGSCPETLGLLAASIRAAE
jgi:hypothetical protein